MTRRSIVACFSCSALTLLAMSNEAIAQQPKADAPPAEPARTLTQVLAEYIAGFDLKTVPQPSSIVPAGSSTRSA